MAAEDIAVGGASLLDGVLEGAGDVFLSDDLGELLRTVLAGQDGVAHELEETIIRYERRSRSPRNRGLFIAENAEKCRRDRGGPWIRYRAGGWMGRGFRLAKRLGTRYAYASCAGGGAEFKLA